MLLIGTAGFLAGYLVIGSVELQLQWLLAVCLPAGVACLVRRRGDGMARDAMMRLAAAFLAWNLAVGLARNADAFADFYTFEFLAGAVLLPVYLGSLWLVCRGGGHRALLVTLAWAGGIAAVAGLYYWRFHQVVEIPGSRLRNPLVHQGQHPVGTGMCFAFALAVTGTLYATVRPGLRRAGMLLTVAVMMLAVMLTLSRGALLALACVPAALLAAAFWNRQAATFLRLSWPPLAVAAAMAVGFQCFSGWLAPEPPPPPDLPPGVTVVHLEKLGHNPLREFIERSDTGRSIFYRKGLGYMDTRDKHLTGAGLWGPDLKLERDIGIEHFHSIYVATYIHSGIIGSALLMALLALGVRRAWVLLQHGQPQWLALLAFGLGGLIFDGQSLCSLVTHPRFENLILWFPLVVIAAQWRSLQAGRQLSSSGSR